MDYFPSNVFKISLFLVGFFIIYGIVIYLMRNRIIKYISSQSNEKKLKLHQTFSKIISLFKILFWLSPIFLIQMIFDLFILRYDLFFIELFFGVVIYVGLLIAYSYFKMVLKTVNNGK